MKTLVLACMLIGTVYSTLPDPLSRAHQTLQGMVEYYWTQDSTHKNISFFFACGQVGGGGFATWDHCTCINPSSCSDCYRWWDAVAIESIANYGLLTRGRGQEGLADIPDMVFSHAPYNDRWPSVDSTFIDDFAWFGIAYLRVYEWLKVIIQCIACTLIVTSLHM